ncbi:chitinase-like protein 3 isoform X3 [Mercenaria mercenaria]|uniref:chitinase-like protein 3 isoform X3 n=1 Tax=Mercenaria mercenaria TaxID=6596 RepID=UPI00234EE1AC|nr:chitinase-like protein 3 isoform X3 [Mercenaria mercenaria]
MKSLLLLLIILVEGSFGYRVVCVYTNWSQYRPDGGKFLPEDVDASLCTHLIYVYAKLKGNKLEPTEWNDEGSSWSEGMYGRVNNLKQLNPELKTLLGVGGWMMGSKDFSKLAAGRIARKIFAKTTAKFLRDRNFDGLTIDWQHPTKRGGKPKDKTNFSLLLQEIRKAFEAESRKSGLPRLLLTTGVSASRNIIEEGYEIDNITKYTDFINVMAYDLHGAWDNYTGHPSQLYAREEEFGPSTEINVDASMRYWMSNVPDRSKLNLGVSTYGRTFTLRKARHNEYNVPTTGPGVAGEFTQQPGMLAYYERCSQYADARRVWDAPSQVAYWYSGNQWIAGEDTESVKAKVNWTRTHEIGGVMIWSLDTDDFADMCLSQEYPILNTVVTDINDPTFVKPNVSVTRKNIKSDPKSNRVPNDMMKHGLSETKPLEDMNLQTTIDSSKTINSNIQSITTTTTTITTLPTTTLKIDKPIIKVNLDKNKKHKPAQNIQQKMQEQIPKKKKEQQQNKTQQLSKAKPDTVKTANNKQRRKVGRRRRISPRMRRKMILKRRQRNKKRKPGPRQRKGQMMMRKSDEKSAENIKRTIKGKLDAL